MRSRPRPGKNVPFQRGPVIRCGIKRCAAIEPLLLTALAPPTTLLPLRFTVSDAH